MPAEEGKVLHKTGKLLVPGEQTAVWDGDDPNEEKLEQVWLEVDTQREGSLTESDVVNVLHRLGVVRTNWTVVHSLVHKYSNQRSLDWMSLPFHPHGSVFG